MRRLDLGSFRRQIGLVPQEPFLFSGTVAHNVRYGRPEANDDDVLRAAQAISGGEWLAALPAGLNTDIGERGGNLSMGQRQLVALAQVLKDPAIFILDEATASVDPFTEAQIQEGLRDIMRQRTSIVIAHRSVHRPPRADHRRPARRAHHPGRNPRRAAEREGGHYAELYNTYFRHQSLAYIERRVTGGE